jgi:hypothetical protein
MKTGRWIMSRNIIFVRINEPSSQTFISRDCCLERQSLFTVRIKRNINTVHGQNAEFHNVETGGIYFDHCAVRVRWSVISFFHTNQCYTPQTKVVMATKRFMQGTIWKLYASWDLSDVSNRASVEPLPIGPRYTPRGKVGTTGGKIVVVGVGDVRTNRAPKSLN